MQLIAIIAMSLTPALVSSKCSSSEFLTEEGFCCRNPQPSFYVTKNCTLQSSISARPCSTCTGMGMRILANCTRFSDTKCGCADGCRNETVTDPTLCPECTAQVPSVNILVPVTAVLLITMLIALLVVFCHCHHKSRQTGKFLKSPYPV
ncbi:hypothetical protein ANANG_G00252130 [Anguilla anguilla]|uniref:TNFR-Cys domain-containing protein n=1 Tax=Anguilla anguilla TaxID=7936 RepID=A0A9D3LSG9_ANGAN|nr:hypothetical protein ANANG_G00252130 [Anguilla anguilla]